MATKTSIVRSCDRCGSTEGVVRHRHQILGANGVIAKRLSFDACPECTEGASIEEWTRICGKGTRRLVRRVVDESVVEAAARKGQRRRVKKG